MGAGLELDGPDIRLRSSEDRLRILVTGATGFIGRRVTRSLLNRGHVVRVFARKPRESYIFDLGPTEWRVGNIACPDQVTDAAQGIDAIVNCAGEVSDWGRLSVFREANVLGVQNVVTAADKNSVRRIVHLSSTDVYGFPKVPGNEDSPLVRTGSSYGDTKLEGESILTGWTQFSNKGVVLRPGNVIGPGSPTYVDDILKAAHDLRFIPKFWGPIRPAGFVFLDNLADAVLLALERPIAAGKIYNVCDGWQTSWVEYIDGLCRAVGLALPIVPVPRGAVYACAYLSEILASAFGRTDRPALTRLSVNILSANQNFNCQRVQRELSYVPRVSFQGAMQRISEGVRYQN